MSIPAKKSVAAIKKLVARGSFLHSKINRMEVELAQIKGDLIKAGAGEYFGRNQTERALVIFPSGFIAPLSSAAAEDIPANMRPIEPVRKALGFERFHLFFDRVVIHKPVKSARDLAAKLLTPERFAKFCAVAEITPPGQVRFPH